MAWWLAVKQALLMQPTVHHLTASDAPIADLDFRVSVATYLSFHGSGHTWSLVHEGEARGRKVGVADSHRRRRSEVCIDVVCCCCGRARDAWGWLLPPAVVEVFPIHRLVSLLVVFRV